MTWRGPLLLLIVAAAGCNSSGGSETIEVPRPVKGATEPWQIDPYTHTSRIDLDGAFMGYLVEYEAIPAGVILERALPTGSYRIQGRDFEDIGFITPRGEFHRFVKSNVRGEAASAELGYHPLEEGLALFFGGTRRATLTALVPTPRAPAPAAAAAPKAEGAGEAAAEGGEKKEGE